MDALVCPACRALLEPALPLCIACGHLFPETETPARALLVRQPPDDPPAAAECAALLSAAAGQDQAVVARYLGRGRALFRLATSLPIARRLHQHLTELGARAELSEAASDEDAWLAWARWRWRERPTLVLLAGAAVIAAVSRGTGPQWPWLVLGGASVVLDQRRFLRRISLSPAVLSRRLGMVSGTLTRPAAALLRRARSSALREGLGAALIEHARLLTAVGRALADHPALQSPFRDCLDEVGEHTLRAAENAVAIEEASNAQDLDLPQRLATLRALDSGEAECQLRALLLSREQRATRQEWLTRAHALLLIRLEVITERLRTLRQETVRRVVDEAAGPAADHALDVLGRELEVAAFALAQIDRDLPRPLPEVIAEVITVR